MASTKKHHRQEWSEEDMKIAIQHIQEKKMGWLLASKIFNVPATTLRRRFANNSGGRKGDLGGRRITLPSHLEQELASHVIDMETRFFGLTTLNLRRLIFELAERNNIKHNFNKTTRLAGWKWVRVFLKRNSTISLRTPENTSLARAQAFNKNNIKAYFTSLAKVLDTYKFQPENIFNVDESGLSTVQTKPQKVFATKGRKQVGALSSTERGQHLTVVCSMNAIGTFVPPAFIFPRKRFKNELMDAAPPGSVAFCQEKGWMSTDIFVQWLKHFIHYTKASTENKILLLLDGHSSHKGLEVLEVAKENGIVLFCFPPHCSHLVQPLDVGFFSPLQTYYNQEIQNWLKQNPGRPVTHFQVAGLFKTAYLKSATPANAINAFAKTGIQPFNPDVFEEWMFAPSLVTDKPTESNQDRIENIKLNNPEYNQEENLETGQNNPPEDTKGVLLENSHITIQDLSPIPSVSQSNTKKRKKRGKTGIINSTPEIQELKDKVVEKENVDRRKLAKKAKRQINQEKEPKGKATYNSGLERKSVDDTLPERRTLYRRAKEWIESKDEKEQESTSDNENFEDDDSDVACLYCNELYSLSKSKEIWIKCQECQSWCHAECAGVDKKCKIFYCDLCS